MTTIPPLPDTAVVLGAHVDDWRAAVREAGRALTRSGATRSEYAERMIGVIEEFGAYVVIAPGLALAHARPGPDVRREGLAVVTLAEAVPFGHPHNDPVRVVIGLAVSNAEEHVASVAKLANAFNDSGIVGPDRARDLRRRGARPAGHPPRRRSGRRFRRRGRRMRIVAVCGAGIGTSAILKVNAERALDRLGLSADVSASDLASIADAAADAQVILTSTELADAVRTAIGRSFAEIIEVVNYFDVEEIGEKLEASLA